MALATRTAPETPQQPVARPPKTRKNGAPAAATAAPAADYSYLPEGIRRIGPDEDFWEWVTHFSSNQWANLIAYLWRTAPTFRASNGKPTSIKKYVSLFDLERIKTEEGSGGYRIDFCYKDPGTTKQCRLAQHFFNILDMDYPPRVPYGEWLNDADNETWRWAEGALKRASEESEAAANPPIPGAAQDPNHLFNTVLNGIQRIRGDNQENGQLATAVLNMVATNNAQMMALTDPGKQLETLQALLTALKPQSDTGATLVIDMLREELRHSREEMKELRAQVAQQAAPKDFMESILDHLPRLTEVAKSLGFTSRHVQAAGPDWGSIIVNVVDKVTDHLPTILQSIQARNTAAAPAAATPQPASTAAQPVAINTATTTGPEMTAEQKAAAQAVIQKYGGLIQGIAPHMIDKFKAETGYDFRDWFLSRHGELPWIGLRDEIGIPALVQLAMAHPVLKVQLAPAERFQKFLDQFFTVVGEEPPDALEPETPATEQ